MAVLMIGTLIVFFSSVGFVKKFEFSLSSFDPFIACLYSKIFLGFKSLFYKDNGMYLLFYLGIFKEEFLALWL